MAQYTQFTTADGQTIWVAVDEGEQLTEAVSKGLVDDVAIKARITFEDALETVRYKVALRQITTSNWSGSGQQRRTTAPENAGISADTL